MSIKPQIRPNHSINTQKKAKRNSQTILKTQKPTEPKTQIGGARPPFTGETTCKDETELRSTINVDPRLHPSHLPPPLNPDTHDHKSSKNPDL